MRSALLPLAAGAPFWGEAGARGKKLSAAPRGSGRRRCLAALDVVFFVALRARASRGEGPVLRLVSGMKRKSPRRGGAEGFLQGLEGLDGLDGRRMRYGIGRIVALSVSCAVAHHLLQFLPAGIARDLLDVLNQ